MKISLRQTQALLKCFSGDDPDEELIIADGNSFPLLEGPKGLYAYHADYPSEGLLYLGEQ